MKEYFILETKLDGTYAQRIILLHKPEVTDPGFYRQTVTMNGFFHGERARCNRTEARQWTRHSMNELSWYEKRPYPKLRVADIYEFFEMIGFDRKAKVYASGERIVR